METKSLNNIKLGGFVLAGSLFLILTLYMIGENRNLLGGTFKIVASVREVNGLMPGNNVRFKGIDVGTVESIRIASDTSIHVTMVIDDKMRMFIRQNAIASIGTDGLMGNKLININAQPGDSPLIEHEMIIRSQDPIETEAMLRTLNTTNDNLERITGNLREITSKLNQSNSIWELLSDTVIAVDIKNGVKSFSHASSNVNAISENAREMIDRFDRGNGLIHSVFSDSNLSLQLKRSIDQIQHASGKVDHLLNQLDSAGTKLNKGKGTVDLLLTDTVMRKKILQSSTNLEKSSVLLEENMSALQSNFLFRKYFRKKQKAERKSKVKDGDQ